MDDIKKGDGGVTNKTMSWNAPEFIFYSKTKKWYTTMTITGLLVAGIFIYIKSYSGAAVAIAAILVFFTQGSVKPKNVDYLLDESGLHFKNNDYDFDKLKSFWVTVGEDYPKLNLLRTGKFSMPISVYLKDVNPQLVIEYLKNFLPYEEDRGELVHENINKMFRF